MQHTPGQGRDKTLSRHWDMDLEYPLDPDFDLPACPIVLITSEGRTTRVPMGFLDPSRAERSRTAAHLLAQATDTGAQVVIEDRIGADVIVGDRNGPLRAAVIRVLADGQAASAALMLAVPAPDDSGRRAFLVEVATRLTAEVFGIDVDAEHLSAEIDSLPVPLVLVCTSPVPPSAIHDDALMVLTPASGILVSGL